MRSRLPERIQSKIRVNPETGCWEWVGRKLHRLGYGPRMGVGGEYKYPHVAAYEFFVGPIPEGLELDHTCRVRHCCNPEHLEPVTHKQNMERSSCVGEKTTHCPRGHSYAEHGRWSWNKRDQRMQKRCHICVSDSQRERRRRGRI